RWRAAPTTPRVSPGPRSPCGPYPARRRSARSLAAGERSPARPGRPAGAPTASPTPPTPRNPAAYATPRSTTCTAPPGAAAPPSLPCPTSRTQPGSSPCNGPNTPGGPSPARAPPGPGQHPPHHSGRADHQNSSSRSSGESPSPPPQLNESARPAASLEVDTEGLPADLGATSVTLVSPKTGWLLGSTTW